MNNTKIAPSDIAYYKEEGEFWDTHDVTDFLEEAEEVSFDVKIKRRTNYFTLEQTLSQRLRELARQRGISAETLLNLWVQEKMTQEVPTR